MKAASLGHQYLNVQSFNETENFFSAGRFRAGRRYQRARSKAQIYDTPKEPSLSASDPLSRRSIPRIEQSKAPYGRSHSASNNIFVVYEQQQQQKPISRIQSQHSDGGKWYRMKHQDSLNSLFLDHKPYSLRTLITNRHGERFIFM